MMLSMMEKDVVGKCLIFDGKSKTRDSSNKDNGSPSYFKLIYFVFWAF